MQNYSGRGGGQGSGRGRGRGSRMINAVGAIRGGRGQGSGRGAPYAYPATPTRHYWHPCPFNNNRCSSSHKAGTNAFFQGAA